MNKLIFIRKKRNNINATELVLHNLFFILQNSGLEISAHTFFSGVSVNKFTSSDRKSHSL